MRVDYRALQMLRTPSRLVVMAPAILSPGLENRKLGFFSQFPSQPNIHSSCCPLHAAGPTVAFLIYGLPPLPPTP